MIERPRCRFLSLRVLCALRGLFSGHEMPSCRDLRATESRAEEVGVLNAADGVAVAACIEKRCFFPALWPTVDRTMRDHAPVAHRDLAAILPADQWARLRAAALLRP